MKTLDPIWTREIKLSKKMLDPLGLSRVSQWMTAQLLPGITAVTNIARNYSFYSWAIENLLNNNTITKREQFAKELTRRESGFVIASIIHDEGDEESVNPHGSVRAKKFIAKSDNGNLQVAFNVSDSNSEGFYGLYYRTSMFRLGLTIRSGLFDDLTPQGRQLAEAYEDNIKKSTYFKTWIQNEDIPRPILEEYGNYSCICNLIKPSKERELIKKIMFESNLKSKFLEKSRNETLNLVLYLIMQSSNVGINFTDSIFRDVVFFGQFLDDKKTHSVDMKKFDEIYSRWHLFQLHEFFTYGMESLLNALLSELKNKEQGMTFEEFFQIIGEQKLPVAKILKFSPGKTFYSDILSVLNNLGLKELNSESSRQFDKNCDLEKDFSEKKIFETLKRANKSGDAKQIVANSIAILMLNFVRSYHLLDTFDPVELWFNSRAIPELSPVFFAGENKKKMNIWSIEDFVRFCFKTVKDRHDLTAYGKMFSGNDTFRFDEKGNQLKFKIDIFPQYPSERSSRIDSVISILEQLGLVKHVNEIRTVTPDGEKILGDFLK